MGNFLQRMKTTGYVPPEKTGPEKTTRSGEPVPKLKMEKDKPQFRTSNPMSLQTHMREIRERARGLSPEEREWRKKWVLDQKLHPDEPIRVEAVYRQLNPLRRLYRYPLDALYEKLLEPKFGAHKALLIRMIAPKLMITVGILMGLYYHIKYENRDWTKHIGLYAEAPKPVITRYMEIEDMEPGLIQKAYQIPEKIDDYYDLKFQKRTSHFDMGKTCRPW